MHLSFYTCNTNILVNNNKLCHGKILDFNCSVCTYKTFYKMPSLVGGTIARAGILLHDVGILSNPPSNKMATLLSTPAMIKRIKNDLADIVENTDRIVVLSEWYKNILLKNGVPENKITVIKQALATAKKEIKKMPRQERLPIKMVFLGRIEQPKAIHLMIEAMGNFSTENVLLDLYGKEEDTEYYHQCVKDSKKVNSIFRGVIL